MKLIITGGGTGGHIFPALAIAEQVKKMKPETEVIYMGSKNGLEKEIANTRQIDYIGIDVSPLNKKVSLKTIGSIWHIVKGFFSAIKHIRRIRPDVIIGTGGYVSGTVCLAGVLCNCPVGIHEQNAFPGMTNKILSRFVDLVMITFEPAGKHFKNAKKIVTTGLPVVDAFIKSDREDSRKKLGIHTNDFVLLSVGGSNGALALNECMLKTYPQLHDLERLVVFHVAGRRYYEDIKAELTSMGTLPTPRFELLPFLTDMPTYLSASDLVVSRAGASTIIEIITCEVPSIVIPSPNVANNHQYYNALCIEEAGLGVVIEEKQLSPEKMADEIRKVYYRDTQSNTQSNKLQSEMAIEHIGRLVIGLKESENRI